MSIGGSVGAHISPIGGGGPECTDVKLKDGAPWGWQIYPSSYLLIGGRSNSDE